MSQGHPKTTKVVQGAGSPYGAAAVIAAIAAGAASRALSRPPARRQEQAQVVRFTGIEPDRACHASDFKRRSRP